MAQVNIRMDDTLKENGEKLFSTLGLSFSTAISIFISQSVRQGCIPFELTTRAVPFYDERNTKAPRISDVNLKAIKTPEEN